MCEVIINEVFMPFFLCTQHVQAVNIVVKCVNNF